jgi:hypothetical protein
MTPELAEKLKAPITTCKKMKVLVADGGELFTEFMYTDCLYTIQEEQFKSDFRILKLKGYDIILGWDWLHEHSPVTMDLPKLTLSVTKRNGKTIIFKDESLPSSPLVTFCSKPKSLLNNTICGALLYISPKDNNIQPTVIYSDAVQALLTTFAILFEEPTKLPPKRDYDHTIQLEDPHKVIHQRAYRLPHHQKDVMEKIVAELLKMILSD